MATALQAGSLAQPTEIEHPCCRTSLQKLAKAWAQELTKWDRLLNTHLMQLLIIMLEMAARKANSTFTATLFTSKRMAASKNELCQPYQKHTGYLCPSQKTAKLSVTTVCIPITWWIARIKQFRRPGTLRRITGKRCTRCRKWTRLVGLFKARKTSK